MTILKNLPTPKKVLKTKNQQKNLVQLTKSKTRESPPPNSQQKAPHQKTQNLTQNLVNVGLTGMKYRTVTQTIAKFVNSSFTKRSSVISIRTGKITNRTSSQKIMRKKTNLQQ